MELVPDSAPCNGASGAKTSTEDEFEALLAEIDASGPVSDVWPWADVLATA